MRAFICDACGKVYKPYFQVKDFGEGNMLTIVKTEKDGKMHGKMRLELCPDCMTKTHLFICEQLVLDDSPADKKYYTEVEAETVNGEKPAGETSDRVNVGSGGPSDQ